MIEEKNFEEEGMEREMQIILLAGDAQNLALQAYDSLAAQAFDTARQRLAEAERGIGRAHAIHRELLKHVADVTPNLLLIHALDHLTMAELTITLAEKTLVITEALTGGKEEK